MTHDPDNMTQTKPAQKAGFVIFEPSFNPLSFTRRGVGGEVVHSKFIAIHPIS